MLPKDYWKNRRERIERAKWVAAGIKYCKGKSLQRELQKAQTAEMKQHVDTASSDIKRHISSEISPLRAMLVGTAGETTAQTKARLQLQLQGIRCMEQQDREAARMKKQEERSSSSSRRA